MKKLQYRNSMKPILPFIILVIVFFLSCQQEKEGQTNRSRNDTVYYDSPFVQEFHESYMISQKRGENNIRSIAVDVESNIWVATEAGVFYKPRDKREWVQIMPEEDKGPSYSVIANMDGSVFIGTWNGLYRYKDGLLKKETGVEPPISVICNDATENYALGPKGIWHSNNGGWEKSDYKTARSVRDALADGKGNLWVATDAGLYFCNHNKTELFQDTSELISCYASSISFAPENKLWAGVFGGVSVRGNNKLVKNLKPKDGIPSVVVNCINQAPDGVMWVGTDVGIVRFAKDGSHSIRFSKRWLTDNKVNDIAFDGNGNAWIATANGVSAIKRRMMTLEDKQNFFYAQLMNKHIREPWICGNLHLEVPGDTSTWRNSDDDNDGEYTAGYLCMESFRYAATKDEEAREKARKAFNFLRLLQEITETEAFFARTIVPSDWTEVHDANRTYTPREIAERLVQNPRYKPVEERWRKSKDGKWLWKGDTSSDEMCGHMMGCFYFYEYAANESDKESIRNYVSKIVGGLINNNYNLVDMDGTHTRWGVWSPDILNRDPDWASERSINSFELLAFLKLAAHITGDAKYEEEYQRLINEEGYLENASHLNKKNPIWQVYFDRTLEGYLFPILIKYEKNQELNQFYVSLAKEWMDQQTSGENLINNLTYTLAMGDKINVEQTIGFLKDTPLDLVDWQIDHTIREDVKLVREPILEELQISELPRASERATVRWDKNPWAAIHGNPAQVREPVFWLWPYWMARYLGIIE